jgi:hypothetical protein
LNASIISLNLNLNLKQKRKKDREYYDQNGNEINDPDLIKDIINQGINVISYHEEKQSENTTIDTRNKRIVQTRRDSMKSKMSNY